MPFSWRESDGITGIGVSAPVALGSKHGVFKLDQQDPTVLNKAVQSYLQKPSLSELEKAKMVYNNPKHGPSCSLDSGIFYLSQRVTDILSDLTPQLNGLLPSFLSLAFIFPFIFCLVFLGGYFIYTHFDRL